MDKRGLSHVEAIMSFVLFISFLIFAFFFFSPFSSNRTLDTSLDYAYREIELNTSTFLDSYSIVLADSITSTIIGIPIDSEITKVRVENNDGVNLSSKYEAGVVYFERGNDLFFIVKFSEDFAEGNLVSSTPPLNANDYTISSSARKEVFSEKRLEQLKIHYDSDYNALKSDFNLPNRVDFGFRTVFDDGTIILAEKPVPEGINVVSSSERIEIIKINGSNVFADQIVKAW